MHWRNNTVLKRADLAGMLPPTGPSMVAYLLAHSTTTPPLHHSTC